MVQVVISGCAGTPFSIYGDFMDLQNISNEPEILAPSGKIERLRVCPYEGLVHFTKWNTLKSGSGDFPKASVPESEVERSHFKNKSKKEISYAIWRVNACQLSIFGKIWYT